MATFTGTNGNDVLPEVPGTNDGDDQFLPLLGQDSVDGGDGVDTLTVDYSAETESVSASIAAYATTNLGGSISNFDSANSVSFTHIEHVTVTSGSGDDSFSVEGSSLANGATVDLDAGAGQDLLALNVASLTDTTTFVVAGGAITSNRGSFANFERFDITSGIGNDTITTGDGDDIVRGGDGDDTITTNDGVDTIYSGGGTNTIDAGLGNDTIYSEGVDAVEGGGGTDTWVGNLSADTAGITLNWSGGGSATLNNGTTLSGIENIQLTTGIGDDTVSTTGGNITLQDAGNDLGATDSDTLTVDYSAETESVSANIYAYATTNLGWQHLEL